MSPTKTKVMLGCKTLSITPHRSFEVILTWEKCVDVVQSTYASPLTIPNFKVMDHGDEYRGG